MKQPLDLLLDTVHFRVERCLRHFEPALEPALLLLHSCLEMRAGRAHPLLQVVLLPLLANAWVRHEQN